ncbi:Chitinase CLP [Cardamine amara subsp. amara]|uniref:Chitinase CLP n=1 Tax=Cardamine amara subsp. amara TaxID=228776 RepID=A0ABD0ZW56_CARAN
MKKCILLSLLLFSAYTCVSTQKNQPQNLVSTVTKNPILPLFTFTINNNEEYFISISGPYIVRNCNNSLPRPIVPCDSAACVLAGTFNPHQCPLTQNIITQRGCVCQATAFEPFKRICNSNQFTFGNFSMSTLNPKSPSVTFNNLNYLCIPQPFLADFPPGVFGLMGLSPTPLAGWNQLTPPRLGLEKKFALCLPSDENPRNKGAIYFGGGPYMLRNVDARSMLSYTRLIRNPRKRNTYFVRLYDISVNNKKILLARNTFDFDSNRDGGVALSTATFYTTLRSDIYKVFTEAFLEATSDIPRVSNTTSLEFCYKSTTNFQVPRIDLSLADEKIWTFFAANSMRKVSDAETCLAFVNGGNAPEQAVVIGLYQMENTLMEFDVGRCVFGFSSSLGLVNSSCGDFQTRL